MNTNKPIIDPAIEAELIRDEEPRRCRKCDGEGYVTWQENMAPYGSGMCWSYTFMEICPECMEKNRCPRCGREMLDSPLSCACGFTVEPELRDIIEQEMVDDAAMDPNHAQ